MFKNISVLILAQSLIAGSLECPAPIMTEVLGQLFIAFEHIENALLMLPKLTDAHIVEGLWFLLGQLWFGRLVLPLQFAGEDFVMQTVLVVKDLVSYLTVAILRPFALLPKGDAELTPLDFIVDEREV